MPEVIAPALQGANLRQAEFVRNVWCVTVPPKVPVDSVLRPEFWQHVAKQFKPYDRIECRAQDNAWWADLMVSKVEPLAVHVWALSYTDLQSQATQLREQQKASEAQPQYGVSFAPKHRWRVTRGAEVIHKDEPTEEAAKAWLEAHLTAA